jgi:RNA polymerase sigma-70 factor (ECF subfamily)
MRMGTAIAIVRNITGFGSEMARPERSLTAALVEAARRGDRPAFGQLYDIFSGMVHGILLARVPREEVEDLVQDVFITAMKKLTYLRDLDAFGPWVAQITRNRANDYYRRTPQTVELLDTLGEPTEARATSERPDATRALESIRSLPEAYRETLVLRLVEGMTGPEIAARTGLTPASVRVNLHRGMKILREKLGEKP